MKAREGKAERLAGLVLGTWFLVHILLLGGAEGFVAPSIFFLLLGMVLRVFEVFPSSLLERFLILAAALASAFLWKTSASFAGEAGGMVGAALLLRPISPRRGLWILLCAIVLLASITLQDSESIGAVFVIVDVAVLMLVAQQIHSPPEARASVLELIFRSLRLVVPVALVVTLVFWIFPAISQRTNASFIGFTGSDVLDPGDSPDLRWTGRVSFVAAFPATSPVPPAAELYWRGQVHEKNEGLRWSRDPARINSAPATKGFAPSAATWRYRQLLGPERILACLERPLSVATSQDSVVVLRTGDSLFFVLGTEDVTLDIASTSAPDDEPPRPDIGSGCLSVPEGIRNDPGLRDLASGLLEPAKPLSQNLMKLGSFLGTAGFAYTLRPGRMAPDDVSGFLLRRRKGFCGHYAAAAANMLRMAGIPSRVISGFRGGRWDPWLRTISVRDADAHAWVEAWDSAARHWVRFDPTIFVAPDLSARMELDRDPGRWPWYRTASTYASSMIGRGWKQLHAGLHVPVTPSTWRAVIAFTTFGILIVLWWVRINRVRRTDLAEACLARLEKRATKWNLSRSPGETPLAWLAKLATHFPEGGEVPALKKFSESYESWVYSPHGKTPHDAAELMSSTRLGPFISTPLSRAGDGSRSMPGTASTSGNTAVLSCRENA